MGEPSPDYKKLFLQAQRGQWEERKRREEAEHAQLEERKRREEAERAQQEAERAQQEAERAQQEAERATERTTLPEFIEACHVHLYSNLVVQDDLSQSTKGDPSNADNKVRPERIQVWDNFPELQERMWQPLAHSDFLAQRHFTSINGLNELGASISRRKMGSELDLHHFERTAVEDPVTLIIERIYGDSYLRRQYKLRGLVQFENHGNTLSPEVELERDMQQMCVSERGRRRSPRLHKQGSIDEATEVTASSATVSPPEILKFARPRADQFCVYDVRAELSDPGARTALFLTEYKPPHKLTLSHIYEGLEEMSLADVIVYRDTDGPKEQCRRLLAAIITQAFSYMILAGQEFGCIRTGEASIFLRVPEDFTTVYYFLSVPQNDVGQSSGWADGGESDNRLHLTTVGQMLAFTLQAAQTKPRGQSWRMKALTSLPRWNVIYEDVLELIPAKELDVDVSEYHPSPHAALMRASPIRLRRQQRRPSRLVCEDSDPTGQDHSEDDTNSDSESPSKRQPPPATGSVGNAGGHENGKKEKTSQRTGSGSSTARQYCTHLCLLGLITGGLLDPACPNVRRHGGDRHKIGQRRLINLLHEQLSKSMDEQFDPIGRPGSRGVLFAVTLSSHGYTLVAKCSPPWFAGHLKYEASVYSRLRSIQSKDVPICLGFMDLPHPYLYDGRAVLSCSVLLSFGGTSIARHVTSRNIAQLYHQIDGCLDRIHALGVRHKDIRSPNVLWDARTGRVIVIDFERAEVERPRSVLGDVCPNRKRKRNEGAGYKCRGAVHIPEGGQLKDELQRLARTRCGVAS